MNSFRLLFAVAACALLLCCASTSLAGPKQYHVTGPIVSMTDTSIVVEKGKQQWEIARDSSTKAAANLKVGDRVTVQYTMTATSVEPNAGREHLPARNHSAKPSGSPAASTAAGSAASPKP